MPVGIFLSRIEGTRGQVWIPSLGVLVGEMDRPVLLRRRGENVPPNSGQYDLHAAFRVGFNAHLFADDEFRKEYTVWVGKRPLKVTVDEQSNILLVDRNLRIEGVHAEWDEE